MGAACTYPRSVYIPLSNSSSISSKVHSQLVRQDSKNGTPATLVSQKRMIFVLSPATQVSTLSPIIRRMTPVDRDIVDRLMENIRPLYFNLVLENICATKRAIYQKNPKLQVAESRMLKKMHRRVGSIFPDYWKVYDPTETATEAVTQDTPELEKEDTLEEGETQGETKAENQVPAGEQKKEPFDFFADTSGTDRAESDSKPKAKKKEKKKKSRKESDYYLRQTELIQERLTLFQFRKINIKGDGNCLFRAASWNLFGTETSHRFVRKCAVERMKTHPDDYQIFFSPDSNDFSNYLRQLSLAGNWGDELCVRAIADAFSCTVHIIATIPENWYIRYDPAYCEPHHILRHLFFSYISPSQYDAFYTLFDESSPATTEAAAIQTELAHEN
ncbi:OTU family cysteine protease [Cardiosporidium cionae]|uniref:OTU family cysteine protease n=1 Tax=Cardiosporidium cionae TaxID=476202 RepID=A0ABQ7J8V0_9APIC|nr:OTU family cysteine protease [Cardiosporidium cionae]|eukprot:KAF8820396.1 OTU family cysteine protease [Cardiosporidium cionae]